MTERTNVAAYARFVGKVEAFLEIEGFTDATRLEMIRQAVVELDDEIRPATASQAGASREVVRS